MARLKCMLKWQDKSVRLNGKTKLCTFKWQDKSVRLNGKTNIYVQRLNGKTKVRLNGKKCTFNGKTKVYV